MFNFLLIFNKKMKDINNLFYRKGDFFISHFFNVFI